MNFSKCGYTLRQVEIKNNLRMLWEQHVHWTRSFIISTAADLDDLSEVTQRLLRNPQDFYCLLKPFYGEKTACEFKELLTQHLLIAADLVNAAKAKDEQAVSAARCKWYANAECISAFLAKINPCWNEEKWKCLFFSHLEMTEKEAVLRLNCRFAEDIAIYDMIESEALKMADYMACGIINQFRIC